MQAPEGEKRGSEAKNVQHIRYSQASVVNGILQVHDPRFCNISKYSTLHVVPFSLAITLLNASA